MEGLGPRNVAAGEGGKENITVSKSNLREGFFWLYKAFLVLAIELPVNSLKFLAVDLFSFRVSLNATIHFGQNVWSDQLYRYIIGNFDGALLHWAVNAP